MNNDVRNKNVIVTGAASGIGRAIALGLAQSGANVTAADINLELLEKLKIEAESDGLKIKIQQCNVSSEQEVTKLFEDAGSSLDVLVHSAGITRFKSLAETTLDEYQQIIDVNLKGTFLCLQKASANMMKEDNGGSIILISSINAHRPLPSQAVYSSTKSAMESLSISLALDMAPHNIRVNCIAPGAIDTPLHIISDVQKAAVGKQIPIGRMGLPGDLIGATLFLASSSSAYVTGTTLVVDGGLMWKR